MHEILNILKSVVIIYDNVFMIRLYLLFDDFNPLPVDDLIYNDTLKKNTE